jgi:outer membrane protein insertion porin family
MRIQEGPKYFVRRLRFSGNAVTRDLVIRREFGLVEGGIFSTEALKTSVRRLNQLGYFKPLEETKNVKVDKVPGSASQVDVTVSVEEQNRNQVSFGAGVSQYEGFFGNVTFSTSNFLGRGETVSVTAQAGQRANVREISVSEPYLFSRPISASASLYSRKVDYLAGTTVGYSEVREGSTWSLGRLLGSFTRAYMNYTYEVVNVSISADLKKSTTTSAGTPYFDTLADGGRHTDSRLTPTLVFNTVDNPIMPHRGVRVTGSAQVAGRFLNGGYDYLKPEGEAVWWIPTTRRTGFGMRANAGWLRTFGTTKDLPFYMRYFLGGDQQIRGVDIRTVGPIDADNRALGGNKFALFNAEYYLDVVGSVRVLLFHDAGQAFSESQRVDLRNLRTSSGAELRFFMPVLNVPFRLIWAVNKYRDAFQPAHGFRFAVGTTF